MSSILEEAIGCPHPCQEKARRNVWSHPTTKKGCRCWKALNIFYFCSIEKRSLPVLKKRLILSFNHRLIPSPKTYMYFALCLWYILVSIDSISRNRYPHELLWACGFRDENVRDFDGVIFSLSWVAITVVYLNLSQVSVLSTPNNM